MKGIDQLLFHQVGQPDQIGLPPLFDALALLSILILPSGIGFNAWIDAKHPLG